MIHILTDSCSDLNQELIEKYQVHIIPLLVSVNDASYHDGQDITIQELFKYVENTGQLPKTSAPPVVDFIKMYQKLPGDIFYTGIGSKFSATYQNAILAAKTMPERKICILDSANLSTGISLLLLKAADQINQGISLDEVEHRFQFDVPKVRTAFMIDTLDYLYMGGRCSAMQNVIGSILKIRPLIEVKDGAMGVREKARGSRKKVLNDLLLDFQKHVSEIDPRRVFITHSGCAEDAQYLSEEINKSLAIKELNITVAGATIASHCGPNTIGVLYLLK